MTQKRGLGRGLGALIPGAGSTPAPEQELRTRVRPASDEEPAASNRPVDMFFSGEEASADDDRPQRERARRQDIASAMAADAAQRRGRAAPTRSTSRGATAASSDDADTGQSLKDAAAGATEGTEEPVKKASTGARSTRSTTGTSSTTRKSGSSKAVSEAASADTAAPTESGSTAAKTASATKSSATKTPSTKTSSTKTASAKSPSTKSASAPTKRAASKPPAKTGADSSTGAKTEAPSSKAAASTSAETAERTPVTAPVVSPVDDVESVEQPSAQTDAVEQPSAQTDAVEQESATAEHERETAPQSESAPSADGDAEAAADAPSSAAADRGESIDAAAAAAAADAVGESTEGEETLPEADRNAGYTRQGLVSVPGAEFAEIPIHEIRENPRNPRMMFDDDELDELAYSLREVGVLQPVVVRPIPVTDEGESFELVMGERRWRAARRAELTSIPAIIRETSDDDLLRDALLENLHRTQLNPLEEANAYQQLLEDFGCTQDELGDRIGRSRPQITNTLRLLRLPALVQRRLASGALSAGHSRALLSLDDPTLMEELAQRIVSEGLSVRAVERLVASGGQQQANTRAPRRTTYDPHVVDLTSRLSNRLETPVRIDVGKRKGRITLEFTNLEDLDRLISGMGLDAPTPGSDGASQD